MGLLGTGGIESQQFEGLLLQRSGPCGNGDLGLGIERRVGDVVGQGAQVLEQRSEAV